jgi:hypothetical protein
MRSRGGSILNAPEGGGNPRLPYKTQQLYQSLTVFPLEFPGRHGGLKSRRLISKDTLAEKGYFAYWEEFSLTCPARETSSGYDS